MISRAKILAVGATLAAALVFAAASMPWGGMSVTAAGGRNVPGFPMPPSLTVHLSMNGWDGGAWIAGTSVPCWTVAPLALAAAVLAWLAVSPWRPPRFLGSVLASVGFLQSGLTVIALARVPGETVGIGAPLAVAAFVAMVACSLALAIKIRPRPSGHTV